MASSAENVPGHFDYPDLDRTSTRSKFSRSETRKSYGTVKLDNIEALTGPSGYNTWQNSMRMLFCATRTTDVVIGGATPAADADDDEIEAYEDIVQETLLIFMQVLDKKILQKVSTLEHPQQIWVKLEHAFFWNTAFSFVSQMAQLHTLSTRFSPKGTNLPDFINKFEDEWNKLYHLASSANSNKSSYRKDFLCFLSHDDAKRDFLLAALSSSFENFVDNLMTKPDLTFDDAKLRLLNTASASAPSTHHKDATAFPASSSSPKKHKKKGKGKQKATTSSLSDDKQQDNSDGCSWCRKHHPTSATDHSWKSCSKLKEHNEKAKEEKASVATDEVASSASVNSSLWTFDTGCTAHMTPYLDLIENYVGKVDGTVKGVGGFRIPIKGFGTGWIKTPLPGAPFPLLFYVNSYVPDLEGSLVSWRAAKSTGKVYLEDKRDMLVKMKSTDEVILYATEASDKMFYVKSPTE
jgi:hypothetical protein